jgi:uncharacterized membrane protein YeaQ/YmgE (transglycosylase-associated protein family)
MENRRNRLRNQEVPGIDAGYTRGMQILGLILVGIVIGILARLILPGRQRIGVLWTIVLGIAGAVIGGAIASALAVGDIFELNFVGFIVAVICAVGLVAGAERLGLGDAGRSRQRHVGPGTGV